jgi:hypothetical protein
MGYGSQKIHEMGALIADKGYDANYMVDAAKGVNAEVVILQDLKERRPEIMTRNCTKSVT